MGKNLSGIFAPINTPFNKSEEVDLAGLTSNILFYLKSNLKGLLILGSNGENKSLTEQERLQILETCANIIDGKKILIAGIMYESFHLARSFIEKVRDFQIDYLLVQPPFYFRNKLNEEDYFQYYLELAEISAFPIIIYNAPGFTGLDLSENLINKLAGIGKIAGIKESSKQKKHYDNNLTVLTGTINTLLEMLSNNATGGVVSLANYLPELPVRIYDQYAKGNKVEAEKLQKTAVELNKSVSGKYGVAGVKAAMDISGLIGGELRRPLKKLADQEINEIKKVIQELYPDEI
jgi:4-hydroxy-2-oxoglutarate aldolase